MGQLSCISSHADGEENGTRKLPLTMSETDMEFTDTVSLSSTNLQTEHDEFVHVMLFLLPKSLNRLSWPLMCDTVTLFCVAARRKDCILELVENWPPRNF